MAFNLDRGAPIKEKWDLIPSNGLVDVLVTHGPPYGILDVTYENLTVGCEELAIAVKDRIKPRLHVFGHIHE
jgi:Icc-related predicted phosphoesterase